MYNAPLPATQKQTFNNVKRSILSKNASATDLTQYINPVLIRRRSSLHTNALDPAMKKIRQREAYKTAMCQAWLEGRNCAFGDQCNFAHGEEELQPLPSNRPNPKYKTRICENYTTTGICPFGNRCFFIHPKTEEEMQILLKNNEQKMLHHLEGEALIRPMIRPSPQVGLVRRIGGKLKQFRKMETCGNFNLHQLQSEYPQQVGKRQMHNKIMQENFYENFPPLAATVEMLTGKGLINLRTLTHSTSASNLHYHPKKKFEQNGSGQTIEDLRLTMRKMQQQKSFSSSDVHSREASRSTLFENQEEADSSSSGPHTPPGFYEQQRGCDSTNSLVNLWPPGLKAELTSEHEVPPFSSYGEDEEGEEEGQIGGDLGKAGNSGLFGMAGMKGLGAGIGGKKSPLNGLEGILAGRRSSHIPLLEEDKRMLSLLEQGMMQKNQNKSVEYLYGREGAMNLDNEHSIINKKRLELEESWQLGTQSMGELNEPKNRMQFGEWEMKMPDQEEEEIEDEGEEEREPKSPFQNLQSMTERQKSLQRQKRLGQFCSQNLPFKTYGGACGGIVSPIQKPKQNVFFGSSTVGSKFSFPTSNPQQKNLQRTIDNQRLDKTRHLWASSSSVLNNKSKEVKTSTVLSWTPFGKVEMQMASESDEQKSNQNIVTEEDAELANLMHGNLQINEIPTSLSSANKNAQFGDEPPASPTWAQLVRKKEFLRQKSYSSPAINKNGSSRAHHAIDEGPKQMDDA